MLVIQKQVPPVSSPVAVVRRRRGTTLSDLFLTSIILSSSSQLSVSVFKSRPGSHSSLLSRLHRHSAAAYLIVSLTYSYKTHSKYQTFSDSDMNHYC